MKKCFKCEELKPLTEFYKHPQMADGRVNKCKECNKKDVRDNRSDNVDYYRSYDKLRWKSNPNRKRLNSEYARTEAGKESHKKCVTNYIKRYPVKRAAHIITGNAIRDKKLIKQLCEVCNSKTVHAHHDDYLYPMNVRWLCAVHHKEWHDKNGEGLNGS